MKISDESFNLSTTLVPNEEKIENLSFIVKERVQGKRLDIYLGNRFKDYSRAYIQKLIKEGKILIDGKKVKPSTKIRAGQKISVKLPKLEPLHLKPEEMPLDIIYEDDDIAVINKPAGIVIHPARGHLKGTLVNGLLAYFNNLSDCNDIYRPGIVHRLDKYTSGVLLIAKNNIAHSNLASQFENREIKKEYLALVEGAVRFNYGVINLPLGIDFKNRERMAIRHGGKPALTEYKIIAKFKKFSLLHVFPKTGRTHQIRVHLKSQGYPIVADSLYGAFPKLDVERFIKGIVEEEKLKYYLEKIKDNFNLEPKDTLIERPALHAWRITFTHPKTKKEITFKADLPYDFKISVKLINFIREKYNNEIIDNKIIEKIL